VTATERRPQGSPFPRAPRGTVHLVHGRARWLVPLVVVAAALVVIGALEPHYSALQRARDIAHFRALLDHPGRAMGATAADIVFTIAYAALGVVLAGALGNRFLAALGAAAIVIAATCDEVENGLLFHNIVTRASINNHWLDAMRLAGVAKWTGVALFAAVLVVGLVLWIRRGDRAGDDRDRQHRNLEPLRLGLAWLLTVGGFAGLAVAARTQRTVIAAIAVVAFLVVVWPLQEALGQARRTYPRLAIVAALLVVLGGGALAGFWFVGERQGYVGFAGVVAVYFGVGQLVAALRYSTRGGPWRGVRLLVLCTSVGLVALVALTLDAPQWSIAALLAAVLVAPTGMNLASEDLLAGRMPVWRLRVFFAPEATPGWRAFLGGVVLVGLGFTALLALGLAPAYAIGAVVAVVVLVAAITSNTDADIVIVIIAVTLVWALAPRAVDPATVPAIHPQPGDATLVALGDSYISGEGAPKFFDGTNIRKRNECRRAPTAYAVRAVSLATRGENAPDRVLFLACSGAKSVNLYATPQYEGEPPSTPHAETQLDQLAAIGPDLDIRLVVVSIGGNDAGFGAIGHACVGPGDCAEVGQGWLDELPRVERSLDAAYAHIRSTLDAIRPGIPVLVMPYPVPLKETGCRWSLLAAREHRFLAGFTAALDDTVARAARRAGFSYLDSMVTVLRARKLRICDTRPSKVGVNFLAANPVAGLLQQQVSPTNWFHNSLHPNRRGHAVIAELLATWMHDHLGAGEQPVAAPAPDIPIAAPPRVTDIMGARFRDCSQVTNGPVSCRSNTDLWVTAQIARAIWYGSVPAVAIVLGAWIASLRVIAIRRMRRSPPAPAPAPSTALLDVDDPWPPI